MTESPLTTKTRELLRHRDRTLSYEQIGAEVGLTKAWLNSFISAKRGADYGTNKVTALYEYLAGKKLEVA